MAYSKSLSAAALGITTKEFEKRAKKAGFDNTQDYWISIGGASAPVRESIKKEMIKLDRQLEELSPYLSLTDQEKQAFLDKALQEITPYYEKKTAEIEAGIKEGKVRTAEDILTSMREVEQDTQTQLAKFDLTSAQTEEEFVNRMADLTATKAEDLAAKRMDYQQRMENLKANQVQSGTLTSGIGAKKRTELNTEQQMGEQTLERRTQAAMTSAETAKKYTLDQVALARQAAEQERARKIGGTTEASLTKEKTLGTLGLTDMNQLPSEAEILRQRAERGTNPIYNSSTAMSDLESEKTRAQESTSLELQNDELARREQEYNLIQQRLARKQAEANLLR